MHAGQGLVVVFGGQHAVGDRDAGVQGDAGDAAALFVGDQLEVIGLAADHRAERDQRIEAP